MEDKMIELKVEIPALKQAKGDLLELYKICLIMNKNMEKLDNRVRKLEDAQGGLDE